MSTPEPFTIEQFYKFISEGKLMAGKCQQCGKIHLPPRPLCDNCFSQKFTWATVPNKGKLLTYTIIHIAPQQFQHLAPYAVGIIQLENGTKLPGIITDATQEQLRIGMDLTIAFNVCENAQPWPKWPRYCFKPS
jgi:uncharacterized OB-fold protein